MKKKLILAAPVLLLVVAGAAYKLVLAPKPATAKPKIAGELMQLPEPFVLNLAGGRYAKVSVALVLEGIAPAAEGAEVAVPQEPAVRAVVTDELTGLPAEDLVDRARRKKVVARLLKAMRSSTDNTVDDVLLTDITIQ